MQPMPSKWLSPDTLPADAQAQVDSYERRVLTTGPLAVDPIKQAFVGVLMENDNYRPVTFVVRLFSKDDCPKRLTAELAITIPPQCAIGIAFDVPGFFYEAQVAQPPIWGLLTSVYALTQDFRPIAANTLHPMDLIMIHG